MTKADKNSFIAGAVCDLNGSGRPDVITIDHEGRVSIVQDGLL